MARLNFDARTVAPDTGPAEAIPAGWYNVIIDESQDKPTSGGDGAYLECRYVVMDGQYKGRKLFSRFNLRNQNAQAVEIAYRQLSALCHAVGVLLCEDSQQLHGIPLKVKVSVRPGNDKLDKVTGQPTGEKYEASNEIKVWKNINEPVDSAPAGATPAAAAFSAPAQPAQPTYAAPAQPAAAPGPWAAPQQPQAPAQPAPWGAGAPAQPAAPVAPPAAPQQPMAGAMPPWMTGQAAPQQPMAPQQPPAGMAPQQPGMAPPWAGMAPPQQ